MSREKLKFVGVLVILVILGLAFVLFKSVLIHQESGVVGVEKFSSEQEFRDYLKESAKSSNLGHYGVGAGSVRATATAEQTGALIKSERGLGEETAEPERVSKTNVQVLGIDEPDIVKTNGKEIYFSPSSRRYRTYRRHYENKRKTKVVNAFPSNNLKNLAEINNTGKLLLYENILVVLSGDKVYGYDVSSPENPDKKWEIELNSSFVSARLYDGKIYLITKNQINQYTPYPIIPLTCKGNPVHVKYNKIYHPVKKIPVDILYHTFLINPSSGETEGSISFLGTSGDSVVYMSNNAVYITYSYNGDFVKLVCNFINDECKDLFPSYIIEDINKLKGYDISRQAKMTELQTILEQYMSSLSRDESVKLENEFSNRMEDYLKEHIRELEKTGIAKINLDLEFEASGEILGKPLNQFSLDEFENNLRVATTVGVRGESTNDLYVLDENLNIIGEIKDYGLQEKIYSVRFLGDKGYIVTFKQIDPFFVVDLSDPTNPEIKGKLKIPGYSSYLHPLEKDKILGIGKEGSKVKISLFDVSSPENPEEVSKYRVQEHWSDILNTHHAFLLDKEHEIFFLPGSKGGYVFSYENYEIKLEKVITDISAKRGIYLDDYLYIVGDNKIVVLDENSWEKLNELEL